MRFRLELAAGVTPGTGWVEEASVRVLKVLVNADIPVTSFRTREHDLDKEEKLKQAEKYTSDGLELLKTAGKPRPDLTDEQWAAAKKDFEAQGYDSLGMVAMVRKKFADAVAQFKKAADTQATPDPATKVRLASAYNSVGNFEGALLVVDALLADQQLHPTIRQVAAQ